MIRFYILSIGLLLLSNLSFGSNVKQVDNRRDICGQFKDANTIYVVDCICDLRGRRLDVPQGSEIRFEGGLFSNGELHGNNTSIYAGANVVFDSTLRLSGTWIVDSPYSEWFASDGEDDTNSIQACLDAFYHCKLIKRFYRVKTIFMSEGMILEGNYKGRYMTSTLIQDEAFKGSVIQTKGKAYSGIRITGIRITGGNVDNTAVYVDLPRSSLHYVIIDQYKGSGLCLAARSWSFQVSKCEFHGCTSASKLLTKPTTAVRVDVDGGNVHIDNCLITYYSNGVDINRCSLVTVSRTSISECSQNQLNLLGSCIRINQVTSVEISNNYIENFHIGIGVESGRNINIHDNYINGLSTSSFGIDITGAARQVHIHDNYIYMGYQHAKSIALRNNSFDKSQLLLENNLLDKNKLYNVEMDK